MNSACAESASSNLDATECHRSRRAHGTTVPVRLSQVREGSGCPVRVQSMPHAFKRSRPRSGAPPHSVSLRSSRSDTSRAMDLRAAPRRCLTEDQVLAFVEGRLDPELVAAVDAHAGTCAECGEWVLQALQICEGLAASGVREPRCPGFEPAWPSQPAFRLPHALRALAAPQRAAPHYQHRARPLECAPRTWSGRRDLPCQSDGVARAMFAADVPLTVESGTTASARDSICQAPAAQASRARHDARLSISYR